MLAKTQKVWLWVFGAMVVAPEVLWSPIGNFLYIFSKNSDPAKPFRNSFLFNNNYDNLFKAVVLIQFIGTILFFILWIKNKKNINSELTFWIILFLNLLAILISLFVFGFVFTFNPNFIG